ncbi:MAG TPA: WSC domain-containing protein [Thermoanaerobaculia bacterium]|nr:WSC domain-containing protein [Thermoanaerobaculia bacterium]
MPTHLEEDPPMRSAASCLGALSFILVFSTVAAHAQQPGLAAGSWEETTSADLDGDGFPQELEFRLARHFFPTIWFDGEEDTTAPGGNHDHREYGQPGRLLFRVRPHPQSPDHVAITYALLYRVDGGENFGGTVRCHYGDVEPFAITLKRDASCALGYAMDSIKTWAHEGAFGEHESTRFASGCNWGSSVAAVSSTDVVFASENKHGNYLTDAECDAGLGGLENCNAHWTAGDVNAWIGLNVGEWSAPRHADLSPLGFDDPLWANQSFCGGPHSGADVAEVAECGFQGGCPAAAETKFTDKFVAPFSAVPPPTIPEGYVGCFTDDPDRALPHGLGSVDDVETCVDRARANDLAYAGLQWYGECWGGDAARYSQVGDGECNTPCTSGQMCGGEWRNSIFATGVTPSPQGGMHADSAVRGCSNWTWWAPVYQPDPGSCYTYCDQNGADACEWYGNGDCYVEFGSGCSVQGGFSGWWAAVF